MWRWAGRVALAFLAAGLRAGEPAAPVVRVDDAPEVSDPDLKEAVPPVRQGGGEPVGGFRERGLKGRSGFSLAWDGAALLGWTHWLGDGLAFKVALGGFYEDAQNGPVVNEVRERLGLRAVALPLGGLGHAFWQLSAGARQRHSYQEVQTDLGGGATRYDSSDVYVHSYDADFDLGVELFWPGGRNVSLEVGAGLVAEWTFSETALKTGFQPGTAGVASSTRSSQRAFRLGSRSDGVSAALNVYF